MSDLEIHRDDEKGRYVAVLHGERAGRLDFVVDGDVVAMPRTLVKSEFGGQGIAGDLVRYAVDDVRAQGKKVDPQCSYVAAWFERHPDEADLLA